MIQLYVDTVALLLEIAPHVFQTGRLAMKGGTALNLFYLDMPRLSLDIDIVYLDYKKEREAALAEIAEELVAIQAKLSKLGFEVAIQRTKAGDESKLLVSNARTQVKIEVNHVFRGTILPVVASRLTDQARTQFAADMSVPLLSIPELYGGKLVAALDRQHPRDLYDLMGMYQECGLTESILDCFVCYLAGHNRPIHEVLFSRDNDLALAFENQFAGMTKTPVSLTELLRARERLRADLSNALSKRHRDFLLSLADGNPEWSLMPYPHLRELPALRWKVLNLTKLKTANPKKFREQADELRRRFDKKAS